MKIAVISDIHGNMEALEAVLSDIKNENCEKIFCLGDLALAGPEPVKVIERVKCMAGSCDFSLVQGNTDERLSEFSQEFFDIITNANTVMANAYEYDIRELTQEHKDFLASLNKQIEIEFCGVKILLVHGSPRKNDENIFPDLPIEKIEDMLSGVEANLVFCGHTHVPCGYQTNSNQTVVNVGSVGRPFSEEPKSCYAVLEIDETDSSYTVSHKFVSYDYETAAQKLAERPYWGSEKLAKMLEKATSRYPE